MRVVFKHTLAMGGETIVVLPRGAVVVSAKEQHGQICIWTLQDRNEYAGVVRKFAVYGTGFDIPNSLELMFIETIMMAGGSLVLHVFEVSP